MLFVVDTTPPVVSCPADITVTVELGTPSVAVNFPDATATDNSGVVFLESRTSDPGDEFLIGPNDVTYTFTDASGNSASCTFTITVTTGTYLGFFVCFLNKSFNKAFIISSPLGDKWPPLIH